MLIIVTSITRVQKTIILLPLSTRSSTNAQGARFFLPWNTFLVIIRLTFHPPINIKQDTPPTPLHPVITVGPFSKWGIDFMTCTSHSAEGHGYIIVVVNYFTKWAEAMPTYNVEGLTITQLLFNHAIAPFGVPQAIVTNHGSHFHQHMMEKLTAQLGLRYDSSTPYYAKANGQVEAINKDLITMLQCTIGKHKKDWHLMFFSALWAY